MCHMRASCVVHTSDDPAWQPIAEWVDSSDLHAGQVRHWEPVSFTQEHRLPDLTLALVC